MGLTKRIIPCLDIKNARVVKGVNFTSIKDAGDPVEVAKKYNKLGADELVFLDVSASIEGRMATIEIVEKIACEIFIPFSVGGGISGLENIYTLLNAGCDKVSLNSAAIRNPNLIEEGAKRFGSQCIIVAIDYKKANDKWEVYINGGSINTHKDLFEWVDEVCSLGAGELLLTSMDCDGVKNGYDLEVLGEISRRVNIPIIASGGAGRIEHFRDVFMQGVDAALAASVFHYGEIDIMELKQYLSADIAMRL